MKKLKKLKLNSLSESELSKRDMQFLQGGCKCVCAYDTSNTAFIFGEAGGTGCSCGCSCTGEFNSGTNYNIADTYSHNHGG